MIYIGIDPGVSGGIALLGPLDTDMSVFKMPATERDLLDLLDTGIVSGMRDGLTLRPCQAVLERVGPGLAHGKAGRMGVVSAFTFGRGVGAIKMALTAARVPFDEVGAATWQAAMQCRSGGDKNITKARAQQLFPTLKVTHATADALLIAEYCRRFHRGMIPRKEKASGKAKVQAGAGQEPLDNVKARIDTEAKRLAHQR